MEVMRMLTGKTKNLGVMGWPIAHSLSPVLQNAAIVKAGLDYVYTALPVRPDQLPEAVTGLKALSSGAGMLQFRTKQRSYRCSMKLMKTRG